MKNKLRDYYILWSTQGLSQLGSSITAFALTLWLYEKTGSALSTAALTICSYAPYVLMSIFAGALTDRWKKKHTMLVCDSLAALSTLVVFLLYKTNTLAVWHLYIINAVSGLMNTVQQPASEVTMTLIVPRECYQKTSGLNSLLRSVNSILNPLLATALYAAFGLDIVIAVDLLTFVVAFTALAGFIKIPETQSAKKEGTLKLAGEGLSLTLLYVFGIGHFHTRVLIVDLIHHLFGIDDEVLFVADTYPKIITEKGFYLRGDADSSLRVDLIFIRTADDPSQTTIPPCPYNNTFHPLSSTIF